MAASNHERANYDMKTALAMRGSNQAPTQTTTTPPNNNHNVTTTTTTSAQNVMETLKRLDHAELLSKQGKLQEALTAYEDAIGDTLFILRELKKLPRDLHNDGTSRDVIESRVRVALSDAESLKELIRMGTMSTTMVEDNRGSDELQPSSPPKRVPAPKNKRPNLMRRISQRFTSSKSTEQPSSSIDLSSSFERKKNVSKSTGPSRSPNTSDANDNTARRTKPTYSSPHPTSTKPTRSKPSSTSPSSPPSDTNPAKKRSNLNYQTPDPFIDIIKTDMYVDSSTLTTTWSDIAGLDSAKRSLQEAAILPLLRPDLYTNLRSPPKGILLYGPPGTGKTMLVKAVAHESHCVLFSCSAAAMTSKWVGEGEKLVRTLFRMAADVAPCIVFLDEMDSLLGRRREGGQGEGEGSRRLKTEFMVQMEGIAAGSGGEGGVQKRTLVIGCTNCPWDIDDAVMRRFQRRIYVPLPDAESRLAMWNSILIKANGGKQPKGRKDDSVSVTRKEVTRLVELTDGFSCSDVSSIANEASFGPLRDIGGLEAIRDVKSTDVRPILAKDFIAAIGSSKKSVSNEMLKKYREWEEEQAAVGP